MNIINIEVNTFETIMKSFEVFVRKVERLCEMHIGKKINEWLDNQDVCLILDISPRALQTLRDTGKLAYTQIDRKVYYKPQDVERLINNEFDAINNRTPLNI